MPEIELPEAKPAYEWILGRAVQKVSPKRRHSVAQSAFLWALLSWARSTGRGFAGSEWRFRIQPPGEIRRPLVPDVAFLSYDRLPYEAMEATEEPLVSPDAVVEVLSPKDKPLYVAEKIRVYLAAGTAVVFVVDPQSKAVTVIDRHGERHLHEGETIEHGALPGFSLAVSELFQLPPPQR
jgi:Uma2 family endonuclease